MKIINVSVDIESQRQNAQLALFQKTIQDESNTTKQVIKKKGGKPKGYSLKKFDETRIGFLMKHEAPIEYKLLMDVCEFLKYSKPPPELIEHIGYASQDTFFRKTKYWRCLKDYRKYGLRPPYAVVTNKNKELYYIHIRMNKYIY